MTFWRIYFHIVWTTKNRIPYITPQVEAFIHKAIASKLQKAGGRVYAINGMEDHIHVVAAIPPSKNPATLVQFMKGSTSHLMNHEQQAPLYWQKGYGVFSVGPKGFPIVMNYVKNQKQHHHDGTLIQGLEHTSEEEDGPPDPA